MERCEGVLPGGEQCPNKAGHKHNRSSRFCFVHDPDKRTYRPQKADLDSFVVERLQYVISMLEGFKQSPEVARALTTALNTLDKALDRRQQNIKFKGDIKVIVREADE